MVSPHRNDIEDLINTVVNLTINVGNENNMIDKVANLKINVGNKNNIIDKVANMTKKRRRKLFKLRKHE